MSRTANLSTPLHLTPRDIEIILMIYHYDGLFTKQIRRRFWPSFGARNWMYQRLARLVAADYIRSRTLSSSTGFGSGPNFYTLGAKSYPELKERVGLTHQDIKRLRHWAPLY
jgi:hypothetical protein